ncbi:MAG: GyrI-like domain-containing protein [Candidatus Bathyarchaeota archaeon]|nr:GyrI-like domain-containing protein [Candidatus Bathyarchaeota archaeon]
MTKIDYKKELKPLYGASFKGVAVVDVPAMNFLMVDGFGDPNTSQVYREAVEALFSVSYALKFMVKKGEAAVDYGVLPLEGLWWADDMTSFAAQDKDAWKWTMMIMQPKFVTKQLFEQAALQVQKKKNLPAVDRLHFEAFDEGLSAQILHFGSYVQEAPTIKQLHGFIQENSYVFNGKHHEIYLGDPRKSAPEKLKTILRQPMKKIT